MLQGQMSNKLKIAHKGSMYQAPTSNGRVRKGLISKEGFITPNTLGARIIDADRTRFLSAYDIKIINEKTPQATQPPSQIEANKVLIPLGLLQEQQSQYPFIARIPTNFVYKKEQEFVKEQQEDEHIKQAETILDRIEALQNKKLDKKIFV